MMTELDLSDNPTLEELKKQVRQIAVEKYYEADNIEEIDDAGKQWLYGYFTACSDILRGIKQVKRLER